ncbi:MAG: right-handed parallel beta-helix repeat-containing protein [Candidatus Thorarchaeota archaeon]|nr:right-handed parallel beta-helix repeat-containing protein [Candidatus Thorarchaeota archaeon]
MGARIQYGLLLLIVLMLPSFSVTAPVVSVNQSRFHSFDTSQLEEHAPIYIHSNEAILEQAAEEGWPGTGTAEDPVIIEGYKFRVANHMIRLSYTDLHVVIRNNEFDGVARVLCGIVLAGTRNVVIANNTIHFTAVGVHLIRCNLTTISGNEIYDNQWDGVFFDYFCYENTITGNEFYNNEEGALFATGYNCNNTFSDNIVHDSMHSVILATGSDNNTISNNRIFDLSDDGLFIATSGNTITGNWIYNTQGHGVTIASSTHQNYVVENWIANNTGFGVAINSADNTIVEFNDFIDNTLPQACDNGTENIFHQNFWNDWTARDEDSNGFVDQPYLVSGTGGNIDVSPIATAHHLTPVWYNTTTDPGLDFDIVPIVLLGGAMGAALIILKQRKSDYMKDFI